MFVDLLKRYLLIVWNFFFGQGSDSIQDCPSCPKDESADSKKVAPSAELDTNNEDDIEEIFDDDDEEEIENEDEDEDEDEDEEVVVVPTKPEDKTIINNIPTKPSVLANKIEEVKVPEVPKVKDDVEIKKNELPKVEIKDKENSKREIDGPKKNEETSKLKPEFEIIEREASKIVPEKDTQKSKLEFEIIEREATNIVPEKDTPKSEFEIIEKEASKVVPEKELPKLKPEGEIKDKEVPKVVPRKDVPSTKPEAEIKEKEVSKVLPDKDFPKSKPEVEIKEVPKVVPEKITSHVQFEKDEVSDEEKNDDGKTLVAASSSVKIVPPKPFSEKATASAGSDDHPAEPMTGHQKNAHFVELEKGDVNASKIADVPTDDGSKKIDRTIDEFLSGEQRHSSRLQDQQEFIQDQQLEYSDSGEELSDDDIEIDYEDDEEDDDVEEVEEVKPLPPVARSVYKKND